MSPSLSTVHVDANKIGIAVCQILSNIKEDNRNEILVAVDLIQRETS